jgi:uncharacterized protein (TIGR02421 family)
MRNVALDLGEPMRGSLNSRQKQIRELSDRLVEAQRPLRILESVQWHPEVEARFFAQQGRELPRVTREMYSRATLPFDRRAKVRELLELENDICHQLGHANACSQMMVRRCHEYRQVVELIASRGQPAFARQSERLFGRSTWRSPLGGMSLREFCGLVKQAVAHLGDPGRDEEGPFHDAHDAADILRQNLDRHFGAAVQFRVRVNHGLSAHASAGGATISLRADTCYAEREIRLLEVHEGWVHLATTLNGRSQPCCTFLSKCSPSATVTQEGLAVLTEILAGTSHRLRLLRLANRIEAIARAEEGADFLDVYRFYLEEGELPRAAYQQAHRVFRGSLPSGCGPFTKDLGYSRGLILLLEFLNRAERAGVIGQAAYLFCGKTCISEVPHLAELAAEGFIAEPHWLPPPFAAQAVLELWSRVTQAVSVALRDKFQSTFPVAVESLPKASMLA